MITDCPPPPRLEDLLAGRLPPDADAELTAHVEGCAACQRHLERLTELADADATDHPAPVDDGAARVGRLLRLMPPTAPTPRPVPVAPSVTVLGTGVPRWPPVGPMPARVGRYEVVRELGRGGMGVVYLAHDPRLKRPVALKMILAAEYAGPEVRLRFQTEAETVARLRHPNIVPIYEVGEQEGRPFIALEFLDGGSLGERTGGQPQPPRVAAELVRTLALALDHAHRQGVVHRDLKPGNVLLAADGTPKVTDFGLAKFVTADDPAAITSLGLSSTGAIVGTPSYMAPEQAAGQVHGITPAADVYALGAILYELLTGRPPFRGVNAIETLSEVQQRDPLPPRAVQPGVPRDLETVCLRCLRKEPAKRYPSAAALADDLGRFLAGEPVRARPVSAWGRAWRWVRRRPAVAAAVGAVAAVTVLGAAGVAAALAYALAGWDRAERAEHREVGLRQQAEGARDQAITARDAAEANAYFAHIAQAWLEWRQNNPARTDWLLDQCRPADGAPDRRGWEWGFLRRLVHADRLTVEADLYVEAVAVRPDGRQFAAASGNPFSAPPSGGVRVWDFPGGGVRRLDLPAGWYTCVAYSPDGRWLAAAGPVGSTVDLCPLTPDAQGPIIQLKGAVGRPLGRPRRLTFSPDGRYLAAVGEKGGALTWDLTGAVPAAAGAWPGADPFGGLAFSPDGRTVALVKGDAIRLCDPATGEERGQVRGTAGGLAFSPTGDLLAACDGTAVRLLRPSDGGLVTRLAGHEGPVMGLAFSPDGKSLATAGADRTVRLWDVARGAERLVLRGHTGRVTCVEFFPDSRTVVSGSQQPGEVKVWDAAVAHQEFVRVPGASGNAVTFTADGRGLVVVGGDWVAEVDLATQSRKALLQAAVGWDRWPATLAALSAGGRVGASVDRANRRTVRVMDLAAGREVARLDGGLGEVVHVAVSPDGRRAATAALGRTGDDYRRLVVVWDAATGGRVAEFRPAAVRVRHLYGGLVFSPDGARLAYDDYRMETGPDGRPVPAEARIVVRDVASDREPAAFTIPRAVVMAIAFSPDGRFLAAGTFDEQVYVWDVATGARLHAAPLEGPAHQLAFSPDGRRLAGVNREAVKLWDVATGHEVLILRAAQPRTWDMPFNPKVFWSPDGRKLAATNHDGAVSIWDATEPKLSTDR
ncbi:MAG TPA: serine/threonine-protein kinase [Gemmataceae bacterium]|jgi:WD40 repeat protein/predicted Ser/Thr protein kinase